MRAVMRDNKGRFMKGNQSGFQFQKCIHHSLTTEFKKGENLGEDNNNWHGGKSIHGGYIEIKRDNHPFANDRGYVLEHRLVMEKHLCRYLEPKEVVHHINGNKQDNRIENLQLMINQSEHKHNHTKDMSDRFCVQCEKKETYMNPSGHRRWFRHPITKQEWLCKRCYQQEWRLSLKSVVS